jgi:hypothetical protein
MSANSSLAANAEPIRYSAACQPTEKRKEDLVQNLLNNIKYLNLRFKKILENPCSVNALSGPQLNSSSAFARRGMFYA